MMKTANKQSKAGSRANASGLGSADIRSRRRFVAQALAGTTVSLLGATYVFEGELRAAQWAGQRRPDGRPRLPPGQKVLTKLKPMGGREGPSAKSSWRLRIHGEVERPATLDYRQLLASDTVKRRLDVHCVTGWSLLDEWWEGVELAELARLVGVKSSARHVIFEAAHGYTANVPLKHVLRPGNLIAHRHAGRSLAVAHGAPVRAVVPDLYFWKSAKWLTGIRFSRRDSPGYWERRGYHNHGDPWAEERYG